MKVIKHPCVYIVGYQLEPDVKSGDSFSIKNLIFGHQNFLLHKHVFHSFEQNLPKYFLKTLLLISRTFSSNAFSMSFTEWKAHHQPAFYPQAAQCEIYFYKYKAVVPYNLAPKQDISSKRGMWMNDW
jgi:hypothetical protein